MICSLLLKDRISGGALGLLIWRMMGYSAAQSKEFQLWGERKLLTPFCCPCFMLVSSTHVSSGLPQKCMQRKPTWRGVRWLSVFNYKVDHFSESWLPNTRIQICSCWCLSQWVGIHESLFFIALKWKVHLRSFSSIIFLLLDNPNSNCWLPARHIHLLILLVLLKSTWNRHTSSLRLLQVLPSMGPAQ